MKITFDWTQEKKDLVCAEIEKWIRKQGSAACFGEGIMQDDDCQIYAPVLMATLVDDIIKPEVEDEE